MFDLDFIGEWRLVDFVTELPDGRRLLPLGESPVGVGVYTEDGWMSAHLMRRDRAPFGDGRRPGVDPIEPDLITAAAAGYIGYAGRWRVDRETQRIAHHVELAFIPDWIGTVLERDYAWDGTLLSLRPPMAKGARSVLRWRRQ